jgi:hypothetical protein
MITLIYKTKKGAKMSYHYKSGQYSILPMQACRGWPRFQILVYLDLCSYADGETHECYPSYDTLAHDCDLSVSSVKRTIPQLIQRGVLQIKNRRKENGKKTSNVYKIFPPPNSIEPEVTLTSGTQPEVTLNSGIGSPWTLERVHPDLWTKGHPDPLIITKDLILPVLTIPPNYRSSMQDPKPEVTVTPGESMATTSRSQPSSKKKADSSQVWEAYAESYEKRYGTPPVRNARANSLIKQFIARLGLEEAPYVAAYYVTENNSFYVAKGHPLNLLLADAEKIRTEWVRGKQMTQSRARYLDKSQDQSDMIQEVATLIDSLNEGDSNHE